MLKCIPTEHQVDKLMYAVLRCVLYWSKKELDWDSKMELLKSWCGEKFIKMKIDNLQEYEDNFLYGSETKSWSKMTYVRDLMNLVEICCPEGYLKMKINEVNAMASVSDEVLEKYAVAVERIELDGDRFRFLGAEKEDNRAFNLEDTPYVWVQSNLGTGKTQQIARAIADLSEDDKWCIVIFTPRKCYAQSIHTELQHFGYTLKDDEWVVDEGMPWKDAVKPLCEDDVDEDVEYLPKINFLHYQDPTANLEDFSPRVIVQCESIRRLEGLTKKLMNSKKHKLLIIGDESQAILNQFNSSTMWDNEACGMESVQKFTYLLRRANKAIFADAFMNEQSFTVADLLGQSNKTQKNKQKLFIHNPWKYGQSINPEEQKKVCFVNMVKDESLDNPYDWLPKYRHRFEYKLDKDGNPTEEHNDDREKASLSLSALVNQIQQSLDAGRKIFIHSGSVKVLYQIKHNIGAFCDNKHIRMYHSMADKTHLKEVMGEMSNDIEQDSSVVCVPNEWAEDTEGISMEQELMCVKKSWTTTCMGDEVKYKILCLYTERVLC